VATNGEGGATFDHEAPMTGKLATRAAATPAAAVRYILLKIT
jgi:hypothetical protein